MRPAAGKRLDSPGRHGAGGPVRAPGRGRAPGGRRRRSSAPAARRDDAATRRPPRRPAPAGTGIWPPCASTSGGRATATGATTGWRSARTCERGRRLPPRSAAGRAGGPGRLLLRQRDVGPRGGRRVWRSTPWPWWPSSCAWDEFMPTFFAPACAPTAARVLALCGERDDMAPPARVEEFLAGLGLHPQMVVVPGADHFFVGRTPRCGEAVGGFLGRRAAVTGRGESATRRGSERVPTLTSRLGCTTRTRARVPPSSCCTGWRWRMGLWEEQRELAEEFRLVRVRRPGRGRSAAPAPATTTTDRARPNYSPSWTVWGWRRRTWWRHSRGGVARCWRMALDHPERVASAGVRRQHAARLPLVGGLPRRRRAKAAASPGPRGCAAALEDLVAGRGIFRWVREQRPEVFERRRELTRRLVGGRVAGQARCIPVQDVPDIERLQRGRGAGVRHLRARRSARLRRDRQHADVVDPGGPAEVPAGRRALRHARESARVQPLPARFPAVGRRVGRVSVTAGASGRCR